MNVLSRVEASKYSKIFGAQSLRRVRVALWRIAFCVFVFLWLHPVSYRSTRMAIVALAIYLWAEALLLWWRVKVVRALCLSLGLGVMLVTIIPGRKPEIPALQASYLRSLAFYEGTRYVWDPGMHRVAKVKISDDNSWLRIPVQVVRWRIFDVEAKERW